MELLFSKCLIIFNFQICSRYVIYVPSDSIMGMGEVLVFSFASLFTRPRKHLGRIQKSCHAEYRDITERAECFPQIPAHHSEWFLSHPNQWQHFCLTLHPQVLESTGTWGLHLAATVSLPSRQPLSPSKLS